MSDICVFCRVIAGDEEAHRVYESETVVAFLDHRPLLHGHVLVMPKQHIATLQPAALLSTASDALLPTRAALDSGSWMDHGQVICSNVGTNDNWNAIDPNVAIDESGAVYLAFGSFWSGIKMIPLDTSGARMGTAAPLAIANRPNNGGALEAPFAAAIPRVRRLGAGAGLAGDGRPRLTA